MAQFRHVWLTAVLAGALLAGCGTVPDKLARPAQMTCVYLKEPISFVSTHGLLSIPWETQLGRGPYVSEREDAKGIYYRAPTGGVRIAFAGGPKSAGTRDGGFYIPKNVNDPPKIYSYFSTADVPAQIPPEDVDCSNVGYITDPTATKLDVVPIAIGGALGGAAGGIAGRAVTGGGMSYSQAAGAGAAGGLIGTLLVAEMVNADVGNIHFSWDLDDPAFIAKLKQLAADKVAIKEIPAKPTSP